MIKIREPIGNPISKYIRQDRTTNEIIGFFGGLIGGLFLPLTGGEGVAVGLDGIVLCSRDYDRKSAFVALVDLIESDTVLAMSVGGVIPPSPERENGKGCASESIITMGELAYFARQLLLKATNAGQTKLGTCSRYSSGKFLQCRFENTCFCFVDTSLVFTVSQHPL